eukprot:m.168213 g.168213  ORF g.168213 m.168213 type:complete len:1032 (-) comp31505_c0_seq1:303-3398(-)
MDSPTDYINVGGLDNLADLQLLDEETMTKELKGRYDVDNIHTYVGDILIIFNPYVRLKIYSDKIKDFYMGGKFSRDDVAPHCFALADTAYEQVVNVGADQCFVISGESGAGKTETTKIVVRHLMTLCRAGKQALEEKIMNVQFMLEPFGNAKTGLNDNSSRFGKYIELRFEQKGSISGAHLSHYLLEKSRISDRNEGEQIFHVFYQLFAALHDSNSLASFGLDKPSDYGYLQIGCPSDSDILQGNFHTCGDGLLSEWHELVETLDTVGIKGELFESMKRMLAGVLHIGNVQFSESSHDSVKVKTSLTNAANMLAIEEDELRRCLELDEIIIGGEVTTNPFNKKTAIQNRDALGKMIYTKLFDWIFTMSNEFLVDPATTKKDTVKIGILDIFGFETFQRNSLEQMCINLTNEQLQCYFNEYVFKKEQAEYEREGIDMATVDFNNNEPTIDLFLGRGGMFDILDDQSRAPGGTDIGFTTQCKSKLKGHPSQVFSASPSERDLHFFIEHYAGNVQYGTEDFLTKNIDKLTGTVVKCLLSSKEKLLEQMFSGDVDTGKMGGGKYGAKRTGTTRKVPTLASLFKSSLVDLMERMSKCAPHFVRCIKPNMVKQPGTWDAQLVVRQLSYAGVLETIKIRKMGYSFRIKFEDFVAQFKRIAFHYHVEVPANQQMCIKILERLQQFVKSHHKFSGSELNFDNTQIGKTKVFMKYYHADMLHAVAAMHSEALLFLQKIVKGHIAREQYKPLRQQARKQKLQCSNFFAFMEDTGVTYADKFRARQAEDEKHVEDRDWLERVKMQAALAEADQRAKEQAKQEELARRTQEAEPKESRTRPINGYFVWERNEHYDLLVGELERPWKMRVDEATGRHFFKNTETKTTTWIDPRSIDCHDVRPHDPLDCVDDQLPFGWDKAETDSGTVFYINHIVNSHHPQHPREEVRAKMKQKEDLEREANSQIEQKLKLVNDLKKKRTMLVAQAGQASHPESRMKIERRIDDLSTTIDRGTRAIREIRSKLDSLDDMIRKLRELKTRDVLVMVH